MLFILDDIIYDPVLIQKAADSLGLSAFYATLALCLDMFLYDHDCVSSAADMTQANFAQFVDLVKTCSANTPNAVDLRRYDRIINVHPFSYFSSSSEVYQTICQAHNSAPPINMDKLDFRTDAQRQNFKLQVLEPYISSCNKHDWLRPTVYVACSISLLYMGSAVYYAARACIAGS